MENFFLRLVLCSQKNHKFSVLVLFSGKPVRNTPCTTDKTSNTSITSISTIITITSNIINTTITFTS